MVINTMLSERFLFLKKTMCILEILRLNRVVEINGITIDIKNIHNDLLNEIDCIKYERIIPVNTLRTDRSPINLYEYLNDIKSIIDKPSNKQVTEYEIYGCPHTEKVYAFMKKEYEEKRGMWTDIRQSVASLLDIEEYLINAINSFITYKQTDICFNTVILYINTLELIDWIFSLSEEGEVAFNFEDQFNDEKNSND